MCEGGSSVQLRAECEARMHAESLHVIRTTCALMIVVLTNSLGRCQLMDKISLILEYRRG